MRGCASALALALVAFGWMATPTFGQQLPPHRPPQPFTADKELVMEVRLRNVLSESILTYRHPHGVMVPLGELSQLLGLGLQVDAQTGVAQGYWLRENRHVAIDFKKGKASFIGKQQDFDPSLVGILGDEIYVESSLLNQLLPLELQIDPYNSMIEINPLEKLPLELRAEREQLFTKNRFKFPGQTSSSSQLQQAYRLFGAPTIDHQVAMSLTQGSLGQALPAYRYNVLAASQLLYMDTAMYLAGNETSPFSDWRMTMGRKDMQGGLLGPLHARSFSVGYIQTTSLPNVSSGSGGLGVTVNNFPLDQPNQPDKHAFSGDLPPGWDIELYQNGSLMGYQGASPEGTYRFDDVPLLVGMNEFRLILHGPEGQRREEVHRFNVDGSLVPPGEHHYRLALQGQAGDRLGSNLQYEFGLHPQLTMTAGLSNSIGLSSLTLTSAWPLPPEAQHAQIGLRGNWKDLLTQASLTASAEGGAVGEVGAQTLLGPVSLIGKQALFNRFSSATFQKTADPLRSRSSLNLVTAGHQAGPWVLSGNLETTLDWMESGNTSLGITLPVSATLGGVSFIHRLFYALRTERTGDDPINGSLQVSYHPSSFGFLGSVHYDRTGLQGMGLAVEAKAFQGYFLSLGGIHSLRQAQTMFNSSVKKDLGPYRCGLVVNGSADGGYFVGAELSSSIGFDPEQQSLTFSNKSQANYGAATVTVFLDENNNERWDEGERLLDDVAIKLNNSESAKTEKGVAKITGIDGFRETEVSIDPESLEDPLWIPAQSGLRFVPQPGTCNHLELAVHATGEVNGTVYLKKGDATKQLSKANMELIDGKGDVLYRGQSAYDGFFSLSGVRPGRYRLRVSPEQISKLKMQDLPAHEVLISPEGAILDGMDFVLEDNR